LREKKKKKKKKEKKPAQFINSKAGCSYLYVTAVTAHQAFDHNLLLKICGHIEKNEIMVTNCSFFFFEGGGVWF